MNNDDARTYILTCLQDGERIDARTVEELSALSPPAARRLIMEVQDAYQEAQKKPKAPYIERPRTEAQQENIRKFKESGGLSPVAYDPYEALAKAIAKPPKRGRPKKE